MLKTVKCNEIFKIDVGGRIINRFQENDFNVNILNQHTLQISRMSCYFVVGCFAFTVFQVKSLRVI